MGTFILRRRALRKDLTRILTHASLSFRARQADLNLKEEIANVDTPPHPAETYVAPEADIGTKVNSHAAPDSETGKCKGDYGNNERDLWPRANPPIVEDEIASTENQLERSWIRAVSLVPDTPNGVVEGFKQPDVAVPTQSSSRKGSLTIFSRHHFYSISPVYRGHRFEAVLKLTASNRNAALSCKR